MTISQPKWNVIILAGQRPGVDALANHFGEQWKALVKIGGEPMLTRVVRSVCATANCNTPIVLAQDGAALSAAARAGGAVEMRQSGKGISTSILALADGDDIWPALVTTADHPLLTAEMLSYFCENAVGCDVAVGMVESQTLLAAYPESKRTWLKFRGGRWSGANIFALNSENARRALLLWAEAEQDRKKAWKLFLHFGPWLALRALTRTISLEDALKKAGDRLGISVRLVSLPFAEAAIDVDKPCDHVLASDILVRRSRG